MKEYYSETSWIEGNKGKFVEAGIATNIIIQEGNITVTGNEKEKQVIDRKKLTQLRRNLPIFFSRLFMQFLLGRKTINISGITSIKIKYKYIIEIKNIIIYISMLIIPLFLSSIVFKTSMITEILNLGNELTTKLIMNSIFDTIIFGVIPIIMLIVFWFYFSSAVFRLQDLKKKTLKIRTDNGEKIYIPAENMEIEKFLDDITKDNPKIKVKNSIKRNKIIKILAILIFLVILSIPIISTLLTKNDNKNSISNNDTCEVDVNLYEAKLIETKKINKFYSKNTYFIENKDETVKIIEENLNNDKKINQKYYIWSYKYYSKENNELVKSDYDTKNVYSSDNNFIYTTKDEVQYWYNSIDHKLYKFYDKYYNNARTYFGNRFSYTVTSYNKNIRSNNNVINIVYDFIKFDDAKNMHEDNNYKNMIKILDTFNSKYGKCYIIMFGNLQNGDYYMYIENNDLKSQDDYKGIFIHTTLRLNENTATDYFKDMIN